MTIEEYHIRRLLVIAQMAATLEAGDRACSQSQDAEISYNPDPAHYAKRAQRLFAAVVMLRRATGRK